MSLVKLLCGGVQVVAGGVSGSLLDDILAVQQISASRGRRDLGKWIWQVVVA